jgi:hypothetical protein
LAEFKLNYYRIFQSRLQNIFKPDAGDLIHAKPKAARSDMTRPEKIVGCGPRVESENGTKKKNPTF